MDIDLLSKMVKELIMTSDEVHLPGVGSFVAEIVPASFSDKGFTINPPYRRLYFRHRDKSPEDTALVDFYAESNGIDRENARLIITDFLGEMRELLEERKMIILPGLGRLRATKENNFFFVADEDLDIYPGGFGLERISLKSHEETRGEVSAAVASLKEMISAPVEPAAETPSELVQDGVSMTVQPEDESVEEAASVDARTEEVTVEDAPAEEAALVEPVAAEEVAAEVPVVADVPDAVAAETVDEVPEPEDGEAEAGTVAESVPAEIAMEKSVVAETSSELVHGGVSITGDVHHEDEFVEETSSVDVRTEEVIAEDASTAESVPGELHESEDSAAAAEELHQENVVEEKQAETVSEAGAEEHDESPVEEVAAVAVSEDAVVEKPVTEEITPAGKIQAGDTTVRKSPWKTVGKVVLYVLIAIAVLLMAYIAISHFAPEFIDSILYSPEELEIINYGATASSPSPVSQGIIREHSPLLQVPTRDIIVPKAWIKYHSGTFSLFTDTCRALRCSRTSTNPSLSSTGKRNYAKKTISL